MFKDPWFYFFIALGVVLVTCWILVSIEVQDCNEKGGTAVKTVGGFECVKLEKVK